MLHNIIFTSQNMLAYAFQHGTCQHAAAFQVCVDRKQFEN